MDSCHEVEMSKSYAQRTIGIVGTGNFAQSFACRLLQSGYDVILGSRQPANRTFTNTKDCWCNVTITTVEECIKTANIIVIAIHHKHILETLAPYVDTLKGKICIDVSNRKHISKGPSYAEQLQKLLVQSPVVKAFNVISAFEMESQTSGGNHNVYIASNDLKSRNTVADISRDLGFLPKDYGVLRNARKIEQMTLKLFPQWKYPLGFSVFIFIIWYLYAIFIYFVETTSYKWEQIFVKVTNKPVCMTAITTLACTYLPSSIAALFQIYNGTKHTKFPKWLDAWLKTRKQMGLITFTLAFVHAIMSTLIMSPTYLRSWYHETAIVVPRNMTTDLHYPMRTWMTWKGEAACLTGIVAFLGLCSLAVSSIKSVGDQLNWREWRFIQSKLGHMVLFISVCHVVVMGAPGWIKGGPLKMFRSITFLSALLPTITLILKIVLCIPCLNAYVNKIRHGWERNPRMCKAKCNGFDGRIISTKDQYTFIKVNSDETEDTDKKDNCRCNPGEYPV